MSMSIMSNNYFNNFFARLAMHALLGLQQQQRTKEEAIVTFFIPLPLQLIV